MTDASVPDSTSARKVDQGSLFLSRVLLCTFAVILLWSTSLSAVNFALASGGSFKLPQVSVVVTEVIRLINRTTELSDEYEACVHRELLICNTTLTIAATREAQRVSSAVQSNAELTARVRTTQASCSLSLTRAVATMAAFQSRLPIAGFDPSSQYNPQCTAAEITQLRQITGDVSGIRSEIIGGVNSYTSYTNSTIHQLAGQIGARASYDAAYLANKTSLNGLIPDRISSITANFNLSGRFSGIAVDTSAVEACATLAPTNGTCPYGDTTRHLVAVSQVRRP